MGVRRLGSQEQLLEDQLPARGKADLRVDWTCDKDVFSDFLVESFSWWCFFCPQALPKPAPPGLVLFRTRSSTDVGLESQGHWRTVVYSSRRLDVPAWASCCPLYYGAEWLSSSSPHL